MHPDDIEAMLLASLGFSPALIAERTGMSIGQVHYRCSKAGIKCTDYRRMRQNTVGREVAEGMLNEVKGRYRGVIRARLHQELPTKVEARRVAHG
jgi:hypothetical protein